MCSIYNNMANIILASFVIQDRIYKNSSSEDNFFFIKTLSDNRNYKSIQ